MKRIAFALVLAIAFSPSGFAQSPKDSPITVGTAWARATPPGARTGAVYLTFDNHGDTADRLVGVSTPVAEKAQLHVEINDNGVMRMRPLAEIELKPHGQTKLDPSGRHVMLIGLKRQLKQGESFPLNLEFAHAGRQVVQVMVAKPGAMEMGGMDHKGDHAMDGMGKP